MARSAFIYTKEKLNSLRSIIASTHCTLSEACAKENVIYERFLTYLRKNPSEKHGFPVPVHGGRVTAAPPTPDFTQEVFDELYKLTRQGISLLQACKVLDFPYWKAVQHATPEQKLMFKERSLAPANATYTLPQPPLRAPERAPLINDFDFPKLIWRWVRNFIGKYSGHKCRFFCRIEADDYWVMGYEYQLPNSLTGQVDVGLCAFDTDLRVCASELKKQIQSVLNADDVDDLVWGKVRYRLEPAPPHERKQIKCQGLLHVPDGEYKARISRDLGHLEYKGLPVQFALPETVPTTLGVKIIVKDKIGTITL